MKQKKKVFVEYTDCNTEDYEIDLMKIEVSIELSKSDYNKFCDMFKYSKMDNLSILRRMLHGKENTNRAMNI